MKINTIFLIVLILDGKLFGMQSSIPNNQKQILVRLASEHYQIDNQDIADAIKSLKEPAINGFNDEYLKNILDNVLFKVARIAQGDDAKRLAEILINAGADPNKKFVMEETLDIKTNAHYSYTSHIVATCALVEARGKLKEYLDSCKK